MKILCAIHGPADGATAVYLNASRRAEFLRRRGCTVDLVSPADLAGGRWPRLQPLLLPVALASSPLAAYDVIVFHSYLAWAHHVFSGRRGRAATIVAFHGLEPLYHEAVEAELARTGERLSARFRLLHLGVMPQLLRLACRHADRVLCLNAREKAYVESHGWAPPSRVAVVANGVEAELFQPRHHAPRATRLLFVGQWLRAKGSRYLADAFPRIVASCPDVELACIGTGTDESVVRACFSADVRERVRVVRRVDRAGLAVELASADIFLFPSLSEGFSGALLEALAAGLPAVTTEAGAAADLLVDGRQAVVVPFADAAALANAVVALVDDRDRRRQLGAAAQAMARCFEWDRVNEQFAAELSAAAGARA